MKIKDIPLEERPVERLLIEGAEYLSNEELLAIILKTGTRNLSSKELASEILKEVRSIYNMYDLNFQRLKKIKGIGNMKAATLLAMIELSKRMNIKRNITKVKITSPSDIFNYYKNKFNNIKQEEFYVLYLNPKKEVIKEKCLFIGTLNQSIVHPREIFKEACVYSASSFICIHNHPSGNVSPSVADRQITERLIQIGKIIGIYLNDHIIIGNDQYYSFFEENPW